MPTIIVTPPADEPISLAEAKQHLRVEHTEDDALIEALIIAAREHAETVTGRAFVTQTAECSLDCFPCVITLPLPRLQQVESITYLDDAGTTQILAPSVYRVDAKSEPGRIMPDYGQSWPTTRPVMNAVTVRFVAGYGGPEAVPEKLRSAMKLIIARWYENRTGAQTEIPGGASALLLQEKVWGF